MSFLFADEGPDIEPGERKVFLATTSYDNPDAAYTFSIQRTREALSQAGIKSAYFLLSGNCHVDDARNSIVREFLLGDCSELIFIDADVSWKTDNIINLCSYDVDLVGGVYPHRKQIEKDKAELPVRMLPDVSGPDGRGLMEVEGLPTGFMRIKRRVLAEMAKRSDSFWNNVDRKRKVPLIFERTYDKETDMRWGGDINFCRKWRDMGGKVHAVYEMVLGHTGKVIIEGSLGSGLRRIGGTTIMEICQIISEKKETAQHYAEAINHIDNQWGARDDVLFTCVAMAREAKGDILELGSGLTTVLMAAANPDHKVYCVEHDPFYAENLRRLVAESGVKNVALCTAPLDNGWYNTDEMVDLPDEFALALVDGPPMQLACRMGFFDLGFADKCKTIICDDADEADYAIKLNEWAKANGRIYDRLQSRTVIMREMETAECHS